MRWEARTAFRAIDVGARLCVYQTPQSRSGPAPVMLGSHPFPVQISDGTWVQAAIEDATAAAAVLVAPDSGRFQISPRRDDERASGITLGGHMQWQDWIVRGRIVPGSLSPFA